MDDDENVVAYVLFTEIHRDDVRELVIGGEEDIVEKDLDPRDRRVRGIDPESDRVLTEERCITGRLEQRDLDAVRRRFLA